MKTIIYLDIDGVLNACDTRHPSLKTSGWSDWKTAKVHGFQIQHSPEMVSALNALAEEPGVTFKWLTTWEDLACTEMSPGIGINGQDWEVLHGDTDRWHGPGWWKFRAIMADVEKENPDRFVWIDDDLKDEPEAIEWVTDHPAGLGVSPSVYVGLTHDVLLEITRYAITEEGAAA